MKKSKPPKNATRLLHRFLRDDLVEEVSGDLEEKFYAIEKKSVARAKINYWYQVLNYIRPFAIRKSKPIYTNHPAMFKNYFKVAFRNLRKNIGYSMINIGGLAVGMSVAMLIGLWIYDEVSFDKYHENYAYLAQVYQSGTSNGVIGTGQSLPMPIDAAMREKYGTDFTYLSMSSWTNSHILTFGEQKITKSGNYVQKDFPEMLTLKMVKGTRHALYDMASIIISQSTAQALFGTGDPINQNIQIDNKLDVKVTGVFEDLPNNTTFSDVDFYSTWDLYLTSEAWLKRQADNWGNNSFQMFAQITPSGNFEQITEKIKKIKYDAAKEEQEFNPEIILHPMHDWHLRSDFKNGKNAGGKIQMVWLFGTIGVFVLLLACINFMNLSTARSEKRAKEVGIRMTIGSVRSQLINQFLSESFLVVTIAFTVAILLVSLSLSSFNELAAKKIVIDWINPMFWIVSILFIIFTSLLAGSYPSLYLSSFQPVKVLKGTFKTGRLASLPRKILVVVQFTVSVTLIIGTIIVYQQIQFTKDRPIGYERESLIMMQMMSPDFYGKYDVLRTELKNSGAVIEIAESSSPLTSIWQNSGGFTWEGKDPALQEDFAMFFVTPEYGKTLGLTIKEGRDFSREFSSDSTAILLNETAVKYMGLTNPLGTYVVDEDDPDEKYHVVGIVKDVIAGSPYRPVKQAIYSMNPERVNWISIKLNAEKNAHESIAVIESVFKKIIPSAPFDYKFVDEEFAKKFASEERVGKLASVFAVLAIFISCLGLFGLASFVAEQRTKEIGIRKVLGASIANLWRMLSKDFIVLIVISCFLAAPIAYYYLQGWLQKYQYHIEMSWWVFALTAAGALFLTIVTVSFQAVKAALMNPVRSLRSE